MAKPGVCAAVSAILRGGEIPAIASHRVTRRCVGASGCDALPSLLLTAACSPPHSSDVDPHAVACTCQRRTSLRGWCLTRTLTVGASGGERRAEDATSGTHIRAIAASALLATARRAASVLGSFVHACASDDDADKGAKTHRIASSTAERVSNRAVTLAAAALTSSSCSQAATEAATRTRRASAVAAAAGVAVADARGSIPAAAASS